MDDRIKELAVKAKVEHCISHVRLQEFAELIVRECAEMVRKNNYQFMSNEQHYGVTSGDILNHFGVEE
jgi:hypothetical protein